jgi:hypothetical protein
MRLSPSDSGLVEGSCSRIRVVRVRRTDSLGALGRCRGIFDLSILALSLRERERSVLHLGIHVRAESSSTRLSRTPEGSAGQSPGPLPRRFSGLSRRQFKHRCQSGRGWHRKAVQELGNGEGQMHIEKLAPADTRHEQTLSQRTSFLYSGGTNPKIQMKWSNPLKPHSQMEKSMYLPRKGRPLFEEFLTFSSTIAPSFSIPHSYSDLR